MKYENYPVTQAGVNRHESYRHFVGGLVANMEPDNVLEIGYGIGWAAKSIIEALTYVRGHNNHVGLYYGLEINFPPLDLLCKLDSSLYRIIQADSSNPQTYVNLPMFDIICIDGNHNGNAVACDISMSIHLLKPQGIFIFHDADSLAIAKAIDDACIKYGMSKVYFPQFVTTICSRQEMKS